MTKIVACQVNDFVLADGYANRMFVGRVLWKGRGAVVINSIPIPRVFFADDVLACADRDSLVALQKAIERETASHYKKRDQAKAAYFELMAHEPDNQQIVSHIKAKATKETQR